MIYLSTWGIYYGLPDASHHALVAASYARLGKTPPTVVKPSFFQGDSVLVGISSDTAVVRDPKCPASAACGIFWMAGAYDGTPAEFVKEHMSVMSVPHEVIFEGTATLVDGKVVFKGRAEKPFSDVRRAVFMLVNEQLDEEDVIEGWNYYPVVLEA